jgi:uncharacterized protein (DUF4213/DUF364 family)
MSRTLESLRHKALDLWKENGLLDEPVSVTARALSVEEAIGNPDGTDFPIQKGKEKLVEAVFKGEKGQAFTDEFNNYQATLGDVAELPLDSNRNRGIFIAVLNAVMRSLGKADRTIHCRDAGPTICSKQLNEFIATNYDNPKITLAGCQPAMIQALAKDFSLRVLDMDPDNIGQERRGVLVEGPETSDEAIAWADLLLVTGTTIANDTIESFLNGKPVIFYGTTISGAAQIMGWQRFCAEAE